MATQRKTKVRDLKPNKDAKGGSHKVSTTRPGTNVSKKPNSIRPGHN